MFDAFKSVGVAADAAALATLGIGAVGGAVASPVLVCGAVAIAGLAGWSIVRDWKTGEKIDKIDGIEQWLADAARKKGQADATLEQILVYAIDPDSDARDALPEGLSVDPLAKMLAIIQSEGEDRERLIREQTEMTQNLECVIVREFEAIKGVLGLQDEHLAAILYDLRRTKAGIDTLEWLWLDRERPPLHIPQLSDIDANRFHFAARRVTMRGRGAELAELAEFLDHADMFRWAAWTGLAGVGKSRLALELCRLHGDLGWEVGFFNWTPTRPVAWDKWHPDLPTLIVFDYVQEHAAAIRDAVSELARGTGGLGRKVRVLLLERPAPEMAGGSWWETLLDKAHGASAARIRESCHDRDRDEPRPRPLGGLEAEPVREILREFASRDNAPTGAAPINEDEIGRQLAQIETIDPARRPLIVTLAAEAIEAGALQPQWNATDLVRDVLEREAAKRKLALHAAGVDDAEQPRWTTLYVLSTMCGGLDIPDEGSVFDDKALQRWIPPLERYDNGAIMARFAVGATARHLPKLEPDMLGELFVLEEMAADSPRNTALLASAWRHEADGVSELLLRVVNSFPQHPALDGLLLRSTACTDTPPAIIRPLGYIWGRRADRLGATGDTSSRIDATNRMVSLLWQYVLSSPRDLEARAWLSIGLVNALYLNGDNCEQANRLLDKHRELIRKHPSDRWLREQHAKALSNAILNAKIDYLRADRLLAELESVARDHADEPALGRWLASGLYNAVYYGAADLRRIDAMLNDLHAVALNYPNESAIREIIADSYSVSIHHATFLGDPERAAVMIEALIPFRASVCSRAKEREASWRVSVAAIELAASRGDTDSEQRLRSAADAIFGN